MIRTTRALSEIKDDIELWNSGLAAIKNQFGWNPSLIAPAEGQTPKEAEEAFVSSLEFGTRLAVAYTVHKLSLGLGQLEKDVYKTKKLEAEVAKIAEEIRADFDAGLPEDPTHRARAAELNGQLPDLSETVFGEPGSDVYSWWKAVRAQAAAYDMAKAEELKNKPVRRRLYTPIASHKALMSPILNPAFGQPAIRSLRELRKMLIDDITPTLPKRRVKVLNRKIRTRRALIARFESVNFVFKKTLLKRLTNNLDSLVMELESVDLLAKHRIRKMTDGIDRLCWRVFIGDSNGYQKTVKSLSSAAVSCAVEAGFLHEKLLQIIGRVTVSANDDETILGTNDVGAFEASDAFEKAAEVTRRYIDGLSGPASVTAIVELANAKPLKPAHPFRQKLPNPGNKHAAPPLTTCPDRIRQQTGQRVPRLS